MESERQKVEEMVDKQGVINNIFTNAAKEKKKNGIRVSYTNIDGFLSKRLECMDYIRNKKPDIMCIVETKLRPNIETEWFEEGQYSLWRGDRVGRGGGGIMVLSKKDLTVKEVNFSKEHEEVISVAITDGKQDINVITVYVPPKTSAWDNEQYHKMKKDTLNRLKDELSKKDKMVLVGDFNCKEVVWEDFEVVNGNEWGEELLNMVIDNLMTQWVCEPTRYRGDDVPTRLDLIFTRDISLRDKIEHVCPLGKSDHDVLEFELSVKIDIVNNNDCKGERLNYARANYDNLRKFFGATDWSVMHQEADIQLKYDKFIKIFNNAVEKFVPYYKMKTSGKNL